MSNKVTYLLPRNPRHARIAALSDRINKMCDELAPDEVFDALCFVLNDVASNPMSRIELFKALRDAAGVIETLSEAARQAH